MTKVVYNQSAKSQKRYIVQFRDIKYGGGWLTYSDTFRFKWAAVFFARLTHDTAYDQRVVDTRD